ncbi:MAG TPA: helix-turn-helix domain-containing protein [Candidatus Limnocylindrales bacterium]
MASLAELRDAVLPGATIRPAADGSPSPEVGWVRVMKARVPAFDALEPGDIAIVPASALTMVAAGQAEVDALAEACARGRAAGLVLVDADETDAPGGEILLAALADTATRLGLAVVHAGRTDPAALERSVIGFLVNRTAELERQAAILETRLEALALEGGGPEGLVAAIAGFLGRTVALEGRRGEPLAVHAPASDQDAAAAVGRYHARPGSVPLRIPLPRPAGRGRSTPPSRAAALVLLGDRPVSELERIVAGRIAGVLALGLARDEAVRRARETSRPAETLPSEGPPWVVLVGRQRTGDGREPLELREERRQEIGRLAPIGRITLRGDADSLEVRAVLAAGEADPGGIDLARRIARVLDRPVAVSRPFPVASDRPAAEAEARATLEAVERLAEPPPVARAQRLPAYRLLGRLHDLPDGARQARALLAPILAGRADVRREHLATLRAVLDNPGVAEAAASLGVHRNTVAYRVRRIEEIAGWHLADPELRLALGVAVRLVQEDQV